MEADAIVIAARQQHATGSRQVEAGFQVGPKQQADAAIERSGWPSGFSSTSSHPPEAMSTPWATTSEVKTLNLGIAELSGWRTQVSQTTLRYHVKSSAADSEHTSHLFIHA